MLFSVYIKTSYFPKIIQLENSQCRSNKNSLLDFFYSVCCRLFDNKHLAWYATTIKCKRTIEQGQKHIKSLE